MPRMNFTLDDMHAATLRQVSEISGLAMSDVVRRLIEKLGEQRVLNEMLPCASGRIVIDVWR